MGSAVWCECGHDELILLEHALPSLPKACKQSLLGLLLLLLERGLELLVALLRYVLILDINWSGIYPGGVDLVTGHCV